MRKLVYLLFVSSVMALGALPASSQSQRSSAAQARAAAPTIKALTAARDIPGARLVEIPESGHVPQVDAFPKYINALLDFIASAHVRRDVRGDDSQLFVRQRQRAAQPRPA